VLPLWLSLERKADEGRGTEVHMRKSPAHSPRTPLRTISVTTNGSPSNNIQRDAALATTQADAVGRHER